MHFKFSSEPKRGSDTVLFFLHSKPFSTFSFIIACALRHPFRSHSKFSSPFYISIQSYILLILLFKDRQASPFARHVSIEMIELVQESGSHHFDPGYIYQFIGRAFSFTFQSYQHFPHSEHYHECTSSSSVRNVMREKFSRAAHHAA